MHNFVFTCRLTITASCPMDLQYFPMDRQLCNIEIESCKFGFSYIALDNCNSTLLIKYTVLFSPIRFTI